MARGKMDCTSRSCSNCMLWSQLNVTLRYYRRSCYDILIATAGKYIWR